VSQGAIGVVSRADDDRSATWGARLEHLPTRIATLAERALLRRVEGGCQIPLGALGSLQGDRLHLQALVCSLDGTSCVAASGEAAIGGSSERAAAELGERLADELLAQGARRIIEQQRSALAVEQP